MFPVHIELDAQFVRSPQRRVISAILIGCPRHYRFSRLTGIPAPSFQWTQTQEIVTSYLNSWKPAMKEALPMFPVLIELDAQCVRSTPGSIISAILIGRP